MDFDIPKIGFGTSGKIIDISGEDPIANQMSFAQNSYGHVNPSATAITSSLGGLATAGISTGFALSLDDFEASFVIRATHAHSNGRTVTAPKAMVLNGESATMSVLTDKRVKTESQVQSQAVTNANLTNTVYYLENVYEDIQTGVQLTVSPVISADKKYVLLRITVQLDELLDPGNTESTIGVKENGDLITDTLSFPTTQNSTIRTRVNLPDQGTVLLGGLTLTAVKQIESGAPVLSKMPILGRLFSNRSDVRDKQILLIMVKPSIILQDEQESDAMAAMQ
ncbi:MAG: type II secretion system protein GspD [Planctomycetota bacterium]